MIRVADCRFPLAVSSEELKVLQIAAARLGAAGTGQFVRLACWRTLADMAENMEAVKGDAAVLRDLEASRKSGVELAPKVAAGIGGTPGEAPRKLVLSNKRSA